MSPFVDVLQTYMRALAANDYATIKSLFAEGGRVLSPLLGEMEVDAFFDNLASSSAENIITPIDIYLSSTGTDTAVAYFHYDWIGRNGDRSSFNVMDRFEFMPGSVKVTCLDLIYDSYPVRDKYDD